MCQELIKELLEALDECVDSLKLHGYQSCDGVA
jgi:hypothetical protein